MHAQTFHTLNVCTCSHAHLKIIMNKKLVQETPTLTKYNSINIPLFRSSIWHFVDWFVRILYQIEGELRWTVDGAAAKYDAVSHKMYLDPV